MKMFKILFVNTLIMGTVISISSYSWLSMWMGLELNLLSFIPLMSNNKNMMSSESSMKYFIAQAMASLVLLMAVILLFLSYEFINPLVNSSMKMMMNTALLTKLGAAPFHFWFPEVIEGLSWMNSLILLTWQKIAPMMLMMNNSINNWFNMIIIFSSLLISTLGSFNQTSMRKILAYSSINHIAWMMSTMMMSASTWTIYFLIYSIINMNMIIMFSATKTFTINQMSNCMNKNKMVKFSMMSNFMSLGGLPPFLGFLPKWLVINWLTKNGLITITALLIITTLIMLFVYMRILISSMMMSTSETKTKTNELNSITTSTNSISIMGLVFCTALFNLT